MDVTFNIKPDPKKSDFYRVIVFDKQKDMVDHYVKTSYGIPKHGVEAATIQFKSVHEVSKTGKKKLIPMLGDIVFYKKKLGTGVVAHEMDHAATFYFNSKKIKFHVHDKSQKGWHNKNEQHAWIVGYLVNQFWKKYKKQPYLKEIY